MTARTWFVGALFCAPAMGQITVPSDGGFCPSCAVPGELVGWSLAVDGDTAVLGSYSTTGLGALAPGSMPVTVFVREDSGWVEQKMIPPNGDTPEFSFGWDVAIEDDTLVVGSPLEDSGEGAFYSYERTGTVWVRRERLKAPGFHGVGTAVVLDQDRLVVGTSSEVALVYERLGQSWTLAQVVTAPFTTGNDRFGSAVALEDSLLVVGAPYADVGPLNDAGQVFLFEFDGVQFGFDRVVSPPFFAEGALFGNTLALDCDTLAVGADAWNHPVAGSVTVFSRVTQQWQMEQYIETPTGDMNDGFGVGLALSCEQLVIGAFGGNGLLSGAGEASVYQRNAGLWTRTHTLDPVGAGAGARFGARAAIADDEIIVTAPYDSPNGVAYTFPIEARRVTSYCHAAPNSTGKPTRLGADSTMGLLPVDLMLSVRDGSPGAAAVFLCAIEPTEVPFGSGWLCLSPFAPGLHRIAAPTFVDGSGQATCGFYVSSLPPSHTVPVGEALYFQVWHRDAGPGNYALSDAVIAHLGL